MIVRDAFYIDGRWVPPSGSGTQEVVNPATEQPLGRVPLGDAADADAAVRAARAAFPAWSRTAPAARAALLAKVAAGLKARQQEIGELIAREVGMPLKLAVRIQAGNPIASFEACATIAAEGFADEVIGHSRVAYLPVGVVAAITPWNYPLHQIAAKVAAALAAGCTVVLKPSEVAPLNAFILAEVMAEAGVPAGVFNLVTGLGPVVGEALAAHPGVDAVSFTGSTRAGKRVAALAAETVKRVSLELGGKSASVILPEAARDAALLAQAVKGTVGACFLNSGQTCSALTRLLVPAAQHDAAAELAVAAAQAYAPGDPFAEATRLGPLVTRAQRERVRDFIRQGVADGATLLTGGPEAPEGLESGWYVRPTVFGDVRSTMTIAREEIFGPVLAILPYRDEAEALQLANDTAYGLGGAVWCPDGDKALAFARQMRTGQVDINGAFFNFQAPFGGFKQSGYGRELGRHGVMEFLEPQSVQLKA